MEHKFERLVRFMDATGTRCEIEIEIRHDDTLFVSGARSGCVGSGVYTYIAPADDHQRDLLALWKKHSGNGMHTGTEEQEAALETEAFATFKQQAKTEIEAARGRKAIVDGDDILKYAIFKGYYRPEDEEGLRAQGSYRLPAYMKEDYRKFKEQERALNKGKRKGFTADATDYDIACAYLEKIGLLTASNNGQPYRYGTAWLKRSLPADIEQQFTTICDAIEASEHRATDPVTMGSNPHTEWASVVIGGKTIKVRYDVTTWPKQTTPPWSKEHSVNKYTMMVVVDDGDALSDAKFDFYDSINNTMNGTKMQGRDLIRAFSSFVSDAASGYMDIDSFASEFGYTKVSEAIRVHNACKDAADKLSLLGYHDEQALCDLLNELRDNNIE